MASNPEYAFHKYEDFLNLPYDEHPWLIKPLVPCKGWVSLYGQPKKARKSYFALGAAWAVSDTSVDQWLGFDVMQHGSVLYFQVDTPHTIWRQRISDIGMGGYDLSNVWFASLPTIPYPFNIEQHEDILAEMIGKVPDQPVMIVFDTARKMHSMDEDKSTDMTVFMSALEKVSGLDKAKILVSHSKKGPSEGPQEGDEHELEGGDLMKGNRGSSAVAGAVDTIIKITPKNHMYYQGRAVGEEHKKLNFKHVYGEMGFMWEEEINLAMQEAIKLVTTYKNGSERSLGRLLAKNHSMNEETARSLIRRAKGKI